MRYSCFIKHLYDWFIAICALIFMNSVLATSLPSVSVNSKEIVWDQPVTHYSKGKLLHYRFKSHLLKDKRDIWIYVPASYQSENSPYPLLIVFDGQAYTSQLIPGPTILDNLIGAGQIPPLVAVFISSVDQCKRNRELPCYAPFIDSLAQELLPWLQKRFHITSRPSQTIVAGSSYGGLAAAYTSLRYPQHFGNVLSQSGAFWWQPPRLPGPWLVKQFENQPLLPIRFYLDVGDQEIESWEGKMSMVNVNRLLHRVLTNKGYQVSYYEFQGGHDYDCWRKTFATGLIALIGVIQK